MSSSVCKLRQISGFCRSVLFGLYMVIDVSGQPIGLILKAQVVLDGMNLEDETDKFGPFRPRKLDRLAVPRDL
jgi:hypothetical protein